LVSGLIDTGLKGVGDAFASMVATGKASWGSLIQSMEQMLLKSAINNILNSLFKSIGGALSGQGGFLGALGGLFPGHADGGSVVPGQTYLVGERGPELMSIDQPGQVYSNGHGPKGGGQTIVQNWNITTPNADSFGRSQKQLGSQMYREAAYAHGRYRS
jgi:phage-related minor tail protein